MKKINLLFYLLLAFFPFISSCPDDSDDEIGPDKIVFASREGAFSQIYITNPEGTKIKKLGPFKDDHSDAPRWSPDGEKIVFNTSFHATTLGPSIYIMNADGSSPHTPTEIGNGLALVGDWPRWSPDGNKIAFSYCPDCSPVDTYVYDFTTHQISYLVYGFQLSWSPDGSKISFVRFVYDSTSLTNNLELFVSDENGQNIQQLTFNAGVGWPEWNPAGDKMVFSNENNIAMINLSNDSVYTVIPQSATEWFRGPFSWSPDGMQFLFTSYAKDGSDQQFLYKYDMTNANYVRVLQDVQASSADWLK